LVARQCIPIPTSISSTIEATLSVGRIKAFLEAPEVLPRPAESEKPAPDAEPAVEVKNANLERPNSNGALLLSNMNFALPSGKHLTLVLGDVGSGKIQKQITLTNNSKKTKTFQKNKKGKSSLLSALLGECQPRDGTISVRGSVAFASQQRIGSNN